MVPPIAAFLNSPADTGRTSFADDVVDLTEWLSAQPSLAPSPEVNSRLASFVGHIAANGNNLPLAEEVLADDRVAAVLPTLHQQLSVAESQLEVHWARQFSAKNDLGWLDLLAFPYFWNYASLEAEEMRAVVASGVSLDDEVERVVVVGAGPLPLTGILMACRGLDVVLVDCDVEAVQLAQLLVNAIDLPVKISVECQTAESFVFNQTDLVHVAALTRNKESVYAALAKAKVAAAIIRKGDGLVQLLYESVSSDDLLRCGLKPVGQTEYRADCLNTAYIARPA